MPAPMLERFPDLDILARINAFELAAIVFDEGVSIDHLMNFFADELKTAGRLVAGAVRLPDEEEGERIVAYADLASGERWVAGAGTDEGALYAEVTAAIKRAVPRRADLAVVPRFGELERRGQGFADAFGTVAAFGVPLLTAVDRRDVDAWLRFTGGVGTLMACRLRILRGWWEETDGRRRKVLARLEAERAAAGGAEVVPLVPGFG